MKHRALSLTAVLALVLTGGAAGCTAVDAVDSWTGVERMAVAPYNPEALWGLKMGRDYVAQGRYELAKEQYLMALAASSDQETRSIITHEIDAVDLMIKTQR